MTEDAWRVWWDSEGRDMKRLDHHDATDHLASMTRIAWLNGAFSAADEIERLQNERDELQKWKDAHNTFWRDRAERRDAMREGEKKR